mmetsp:Transcript_19120/g.35740  ORF Transcript_19120/g.35740 Transcript_19120/m.35740 type:complete len:143 (+) Transcript_19120:532-960(+)
MDYQAAACLSLNIMEMEPAILTHHTIHLSAILTGATVAKERVIFQQIMAVALRASALDLSVTSASIPTWMNILILNHVQCRIVRGLEMGDVTLILKCTIPRLAIGMVATAARKLVTRHMLTLYVGIFTTRMIVKTLIGLHQS